MAWWWSWLLTAIGVTGLYLAGSKRLAGWMVGIGVQALWIAYAVSSEQWGFLVSAFAYGGVNIRNLVRWRREARSNPSNDGVPAGQDGGDRG